MQTQINNIPIILPTSVVRKARVRAKEQGVTLSNYFQTLVDRDLTRKKKDPWVPMPKHVQKRIKKEIEEFEKEMKEGKHKYYTSAEDLIRDLES